MKSQTGKSRRVQIIFIMLNFLFLSNIHGQVKINIADTLSKRFLRYIESVPREEIFVHTDQQEYIAGEDIWFNVYIIDRKSSKISMNSRIAYFEVLNSENKPVAQCSILINKGIGPGHIELPDSLSSGTYLLRAYTSWMKNFLPYNCYMKDIKVYNALNIKSYREREIIEGSSITGKEETITETSSFNGLSFSVNNQKPDIIELSVNATEEYRSKNSFQFYLFIQTHGQINLVSPELISGEKTLIAIPRKLLSPGINQITLFNSKGSPVSERLIYTPDRKPDQALVLQSVDSSGTRRKLSLEIDLKEISLQVPNETNLSIAVAPVKAKSEVTDISEYMVFGSEFGPEPLKALNGRKTEELPPSEMDRILLDLKSNWIRWTDILSDHMPQFKYQVENENHFINGSLVSTDRQPAQSGEYLLMSTPGKVPVFQYTTTNSLGNFNFSIPIDEEIHDLIFQPDDSTKNNRIIFDSQFSEKYLPCKKSVDTSGKYLPLYLPRWSASYQVRKIFGSSSSRDFIPSANPAIGKRRFYGKPDIVIEMKDYIKLPTMEEVIFELIPTVSFKSKNSVYEVSLLNPYLGKSYDYPPVVLIDGIKINNLKLVADLDPEMVERIEVVREMYHVGDYLFYGIVNIITKAADLSNITLPGYSIRKQYRITDPLKTFISPDYTLAENKNSRIPDFRSTLYWNPSAKPDKYGKIRVEFWTSDIRSDYEINIQGMTSEGKTISLRKIIKIN